MALVERVQQARREVVGGGHHADVQQAALAARAVVVDVGAVRHERGLCGPYLRADDAGVLQQLAPGVGQALAMLAVEQRRAHVGLQLADLHRDGRLRHVQLLGGTREAAAGGHRLEDAQGSQIEGLHRRGRNELGSFPGRRRTAVIRSEGEPPRRAGMAPTPARPFTDHITLLMQVINLHQLRLLAAIPTLQSCIQRTLPH